VRRKKDLANRSELVAFLLDKREIERIERILQSGDSFFENDRSKLIRHCIRKTLPEIEKELFGE